MSVELFVYALIFAIFVVGGAAEYSNWKNKRNSQPTGHQG